MPARMRIIKPNSLKYQTKGLILRIPVFSQTKGLILRIPVFSQTEALILRIPVFSQTEALILRILEFKPQSLKYQKVKALHYCKALKGI